VGMGFLFARTLHSAMKFIAPVRIELKVRTIFNILGPLTNPAGADRQVVGVFNAQLAPTMARALLALGTRHAFVVAGFEGIDEISLGGPSLVCEARDGRVTEYEVNPQDFGFTPVALVAIRGGDAARNAVITREVLEGKPGPCRDMVLLNAAPGLVAGGLAADLKEAVSLAAESIDSGAALDKLNDLIAFSQGMLADSG